MLDCLEALSMLYMLELTHVHVLFRNSHLANNLNFNVKEPVRVEVEVYVDFATSLRFCICTMNIKTSDHFRHLQHFDNTQSSQTLISPRMVYFKYKTNTFNLRLYHFSFFLCLITTEYSYTLYN